MTRNPPVWNGIEAAMTMKDIAKVMTERGYPMSRDSVNDTIRRALRKLRKHPEMRGLMGELTETNEI